MFNMYGEIIGYRTIKSKIVNTLGLMFIFKKLILSDSYRYYFLKVMLNEVSKDRKSIENN